MLSHVRQPWICSLCIGSGYAALAPGGSPVHFFAYADRGSPDLSVLASSVEALGARLHVLRLGKSSGKLPPGLLKASAKVAASHAAQGALDVSKSQWKFELDTEAYQAYVTGKLLGCVVTHLELIQIFSVFWCYTYCTLRSVHE